ncbi:urease accessory protein UreE [Aliihoeflea sp. PC F10.4]
MYRAGEIVRAKDREGRTAIGSASLAHDERHLRRKLLILDTGARVLIDLPQPVSLGAGDCLLLDTGDLAEIGAADEDLLEIRPRDPLHLVELAWHIGNRHLAAQIEEDRILILHDHVIEAMLEGLGATVAHVKTGFEPVRGAYSGKAHRHDHHHTHSHDHGHG